MVSFTLKPTKLDCVKNIHLNLLILHLLCATSLYGQEIFRYQTYQLHPNPIHKITQVDSISGKRIELIFQDGNRVKEENTYSLLDESQEFKQVFKWNGNSIVEVNYIADNFLEKEWILKTDSGIVDKFQYSNHQLKYSKVTANKVKINRTEFITDENFNIIGREDVDSVGNKILYYLNAFGQATKRITFVNGKEITKNYEIERLGIHETNFDLGELRCKRKEVYDKNGLVIELKILCFDNQHGKARHLVNQTWMYE